MFLKSVLITLLIQKMLKQNYQFKLREQTQITFWQILQDTDSEREKINQYFLSVNPFTPLSSAAKKDWESFSTVISALVTKLDHYFGAPIDVIRF